MRVYEEEENRTSWNDKTKWWTGCSIFTSVTITEDREWLLML